MKRLLLFIIPLLLLAGAFRTAGYRTGLTVDGTYTFNDSTHFADDVTIAVDLTVSGAVKPGIISMNIYPSYRELTWVGAGKNTISAARYSVIGGFSFDSLDCDSVRLGFYATEDTNTVDSLYVASYCGRTFSTVEIVADDTDATSGSVGYHYKTYACSATIPSNARILLYVKPGRESATGKTKTRLLLLYGHPQ